jgi:hypothetical protein
LSHADAEKREDCRFGADLILSIPGEDIERGGGRESRGVFRPERVPAGSAENTGAKIPAALPFPTIPE